MVFYPNQSSSSVSFIQPSVPSQSVQPHTQQCVFLSGKWVMLFLIVLLLLVLIGTFCYSTTSSVDGAGSTGVTSSSVGATTTPIASGVSSALRGKDV